MFDLDVSKMLLVGAVALVFVGPKELPAVLRTLGRAHARLRSLQSDLRKEVDRFTAEASLDSEIASLGELSAIKLASNPATAMRGSAPASECAQAEDFAPHYASAEMQAYLAPSPEPEAAPPPPA